MKVDVEPDPVRPADIPSTGREEDVASDTIDRLDPGLEPAVLVNGLTKNFKGHLGIGRTPAVRGLDLEVRTGETLGLLGPNGAGKTTTIKMLLGLLKPDAGRIRLLVL